MNEQFLGLAKKLKSACDERNWEALGDLDKQVRVELELALAQVKTEQDKQLAISVLKRYEKIYTLMIKDSVKYRDDISSELTKMARESKAMNSYLDSSRY